jgi:hypothetical protein
MASSFLYVLLAAQPSAGRRVAPRCAGRNLTEKPRKRFSPFDFSLSPTCAFTPLVSDSQSSFLQPPATNIVSQHLSPRIGEGFHSLYFAVS